MQEATIQSGALLFDAVVLLAASAVGLLIFRRAGFGSVLAFLAAGILLGPHGLAIAGAGEALRSFTELGVVFLLFLVGIEMQPARLWQMRRSVFGLGSAQVILTGLALAAVAVALGVGTWSASLILGFGLALSSTAFVLQLLQERGETPSPHGQAAFAILLLQDLAIVPLLAALPLLGSRPEPDANGLLAAIGLAVLMLALLVTLGRFALPWALDLGARQRNSEAFAVLAVLAVAAAAWMMQVAGLSMALGAFVMGMLLSGSGYARQIEAEISPYKGVLLSLFFVSIGMSMDLSLLAQEAGRIGIAVVLLLVVKAVLLLALALAFRLGVQSAVRLAFLLPQGGEFGFVLLGTAHASQLLSDTAFHAALLVIPLSMSVTPVLARIGDRLADRLSPAPLPPEAMPGTTLDRHVVIAGFGRVGRNIGFMLEQTGVPFVALDADPRRVVLGRKEGRPVYFGHSDDLRMLAQAGAGRAAAIVVTLDNAAATEETVAVLREVFPQVPVVVRGRDLVACDRLLALGASEAIPESVQLSTSVGEALLRRIGASQAQVDAVLAAVRQDNYANLRLGAIRERMAEVGRADAPKP